MGASPHCDQVPPLEEDSNMDQAYADPPPLKVENIRTTFLQMAQAITSQAQAAMVQVQHMRTQANREVVPRTHY